MGSIRLNLLIFDPVTGMVDGKLKKTISITANATVMMFADHPSHSGTLKYRSFGKTRLERPLIIRRSAGRAKENICRIMLHPMIALKAITEPR